ncbi:MAG: deoxyribodipyrimidine photo-lyase [Rickettsiales bacterium]|nr:deoxyribodipyrimidine photo-lyase [Rickettsiales bacterium]
MPQKTIVLFQQDLRLSDNPALIYAAKRGEVIPVYVWDNIVGSQGLGGASKWWLHHSLLALQASLKERGVQLILRQGDTLTVISQLLKECAADGVYWNRCYEPNAIEKGKTLKTALEAQKIEAKSFKTGLLFEPWEIANKQGDFFKVFTPFWRHCLTQAVSIGEPYEVPEFLPSTHSNKCDDLLEWKLLPTHPDWSGGLRNLWHPGEKFAHQRLHSFLDNCLGAYAEKRDIPSDAGTSYLSPHLHWGEISPRQLYNATRYHEALTGNSRAAEKFLSELGWREFSYYLLYHVPNLPSMPFNLKFKDFPWVSDDGALRAWQRGETGYPLVDAGMRELWETGYMHNRVRMIVASFLTKHLQVDWKHGAAWFWDTLVDADLANNSASWQWVAGCGADASPYYRIFNPILQGQRFDPAGKYVRRWIPELSKLPDTYIHCPWEAGEEILRHAGVSLGKNYPGPIVNHAAAREAALHAYKMHKSDATSPPSINGLKDVV